MLTVNVDKRITIDQCLEHPWTTGRLAGTTQKGDEIMDPVKSMDSTLGLAGAMDNLDFSKRKPVRERTLLSSINDVSVVKVVNTGGKKPVKVKVWNKNENVVEGVGGGGGGSTKKGDASIYQDQTMRPADD